MLLYLLSLVILLFSSLFLISLFKPTGKIAAVIGWYLLGFSQVVLVELVGHFFSWLNQPWLILLIQTVFLGISWLLWKLFKQPRLGGVLFLHNFDDTLAGWADAWEGRVENILLSVFSIFMYGYSFFLGWKVAPNTYDSVTTHAVRVVYWLQHGNLLPWNSPRYTQLSYPVNAQLQMLWSAQFLHSDKLFFMVQYLGAITTILCVIGIARLMKFTRAQSLFAGLIFATFPLIWMQSSTTQNDLIAAGLFLPVIYFFHLGIERRQTSMLVLSGIALGLSMGTKQTLFFYLPGLALLVGLVWFKYRGAVSRMILTWAAASLVSFAVLSSFIYIQNTAYFGHPLASEEALESAVGGTDAEQALGNLSFNTLRLVYQSLDNSGLPYPFGAYFVAGKDRTLGELLRMVNPALESDLYCAPGHSFSLSSGNYLSEDSSWFGPIGGLLYIPLGIYQFVKGVKKKDPWRIGIVGIAFLFLLIDAWLRPGWDPYQGRYFIPAAALMSAFLGELIRPKWIQRAAAIGIAALAVVILSYTAVVNPGKWLLGEAPRVGLLNENIARTFDVEWDDAVTLQNQSARIYSGMVKANVPPDATLGWYAGNFIEYPLFGERFARTLVPVVPRERLSNQAWLSVRQIEYLLIDADILTDPLPDGFVAIDSAYNWLLLKRK